MLHTVNLPGLSSLWGGSWTAPEAILSLCCVDEHVYCQFPRLSVSLGYIFGNPRSDVVDMLHIWASEGAISLAFDVDIV